MNKIEKKLFKLFEYQKFEKNAKLEQVIDETQEAAVVELSEDALFGVAGGKEQPIIVDDKGTDMNGAPPKL